MYNIKYSGKSNMKIPLFRYYFAIIYINKMFNLPTSFACTACGLIIQQVQF